VLDWRCLHEIFPPILQSKWVYASSPYNTTKLMYLHLYRTAVVHKLWGTHIIKQNIIWWTGKYREVYAENSGSPHHTVCLKWKVIFTLVHTYIFKQQTVVRIKSQLIYIGPLHDVNICVWYHYWAHFHSHTSNDIIYSSTTAVNFSISRLHSTVQF